MNIEIDPNNIDHKAMLLLLLDDVEVVEKIRKIINQMEAVTEQPEPEQEPETVPESKSEEAVVVNLGMGQGTSVGALTSRTDKTEILQLQQQLKEQKAAYEQKVAELELVKQGIVPDPSQEEDSPLNLEIQELKQRCHVLEVENKNLESEKEIDEKRYYSYRKSCNEEKEGLQEEIRKTKKANDTLTEEKSLIQVDKTRLEAENNAIKIEKQVLEGSVNMIKEEKRALEDGLKTLEVEKQVQDGVVRTLEGEIQGLLGKKQGLEVQLERFQLQLDHFETEQASFILYQNLSPELKQNLKSIFREEKFENFVACCAQRDAVEALWLFAKTRVFHNDLSEIQALKEIFRYTLYCQNSTLETPVFHLVEGDSGMSFDTEYHIGTPDSQKAGNIRQMFFPGYAVGKDKKIKQKAIVQVM